ncbi:hypothetical protein RUM43_007822 [Polyplax serrata]|uniref:Uncharacterized protein n=1 Tax=Polyplax serrata TaxID=468196 RepID=A0AAN8P2F8_POLSC
MKISSLERKRKEAAEKAFLLGNPLESQCGERKTKRGKSVAGVGAQWLGPIKAPELLVRGANERDVSSTARLDTPLTD